MKRKHYDWRFYQRSTSTGEFYLALIYEDGCDWLRTLEMEEATGMVKNEQSRIERPIEFGMLTILRDGNRLHYTEISSTEVPENLMRQTIQYERDHQPRLAVAA